MSLAAAPRPDNEDRRVQVVQNTGIIDTNQGDLFRVYCEIAKDLLDYDAAIFSLFDSDDQCHIAKVGMPNSDPDTKGNRNTSLCSYVLLETEPLLIPNICEHKVYSQFPAVQSGEFVGGYAGFPVINKDNYALGTLCMLNWTPKETSPDKVALVKKLTKRIAHQLDTHTEQKEVTSQKIIKAMDIFFDRFETSNNRDFRNFMSLLSNMPVAIGKLDMFVEAGLCEADENGRGKLTTEGQKFQVEMGLQTKVLNKVRVEGDAAESMVNDMLSQLETL
jgi:hypothetical protein